MQRVEPRIGAARGRQAPVRKRRKKWLIALLGFGSVLCLAALAGSAYFYLRLEEARTLIPQLPAIMKTTAVRPSEIVSADGVVLYRLANEIREPVNYEDLPKHVIDATLAAEDKRFFNHGGIDTVAMLRVLWVASLTGRASQGGSTLTMQLAKRVFTDSERSVERKIKDMSLALMIERQLTKEQILTLYLNQVFYGNGAYGIQMASEIYFGKDVKDLTIAEAALLARCVRRPSSENPRANLERAIENRNVVLAIMREEGWITQEQFNKARQEKVKLRQSSTINSVLGTKKEGYFVDYVMSQLRRNYPEIDISSGGYRVETTLNTKIQDTTDRELMRVVERNRGARVTTAAMLITDNEGRIKAMSVASRHPDYQFNIPALARRQPGSSFKPFVYAAAIELGAIDAAGSVKNDPYFIRTASGRKKVDGGGRGGRVSTATALAQSINTPAMWIIDAVGPGNAVKVSRNSFGFTSNLPAVSSLALGTGEVSMIEMARGYSVFQSGGDRYEPYAITRIVGPDGATIARINPKVTRRALSAATAADMDRLMRGVVTGGTGKAASGVVNARGKTGTTNSYKDAWFCGYTNNFIAIAWLGNDVKNPSGNPPYVAGTMAGVFGGQVTAPAWARVMRAVQAEFPEARRQIATPFIEREPEEPADEDPTADIQQERDVISNEPPEPGTRRDTPRDPSVRPGENPGNMGRTPSDPNRNPEFPPEESATNPKPKDPARTGGGTGGGTTGGGSTGGTDGGSTGGSSTGGGTTGGGSTGGGAGAGTVTIEVCADSGARASAYCPERRRETFPRGSAPRGRCPIHGPHSH